MVKRKAAPQVFVPHRRYGALPHVSGTVMPEAAVRQGHWSLARGLIFPASVLVANPARQNYSLYPRTCYVDAARKCRTCKRDFVFSAREQRHWYETLQFFVDADCVECPECRIKRRALRRRLARYSALSRRPAPTNKELMFLVDDALYLLACGVLRDLDRLGQLKNRALKAIPDYPASAALATAIAAARARQMPAPAPACLPPA